MELHFNLQTLLNRVGLFLSFVLAVIPIVLYFLTNEISEISTIYIYIYMVIAVID